MTVLGPNDPRAIVRERPYFIVFKDREGETREFWKVTTWPEFLQWKNLLKREEFEVLRWGIYTDEELAEAQGSAA